MVMYILSSDEVFHSDEADKLRLSDESIFKFVTVEYLQVTQQVHNTFHRRQQDAPRLLTDDSSSDRHVVCMYAVTVYVRATCD